MEMRLLIADADADRANLVRCAARALWSAGEALTGGDNATALRLVAGRAPDLIVLGRASRTGQPSLCGQVRAATPAPILVLGARDGALEEVRALEAGADSYLAAPLEQVRLLAHLRALARRVGTPCAGVTAPAPSGAIVVDDLAIDLASRIVRRDGVAIALTPTEYVLLATLAGRPGQLIPQPTLVAQVWGGAHARDTHYVKVFVNRLRRKLGDSAAYPRYIKTRRGQGYRLAAAR